MCGGSPPLQREYPALLSRDTFFLQLNCLLPSIIRLPLSLSKDLPSCLGERVGVPSREVRTLHSLPPIFIVRFSYVGFFQCRIVSFFSAFSFFLSGFIFERVPYLLMSGIEVTFSSTCAAFFFFYVRELARLFHQRLFLTCME